MLGSVLFVCRGTGSHPGTVPLCQETALSPRMGTAHIHGKEWCPAARDWTVAMGFGQGHAHVLGQCSAYGLGTEWSPWAEDRTVFNAGDSAEPGLCPCA